MSEDICGICRELLLSNTKTLACNHVFHAECIDAWTERVNQCPYCRRPVLTRIVPQCVKDYVRPMGSNETRARYNQRVFQARRDIHEMFESGAMPAYVAQELLEDTELITNNDLVYGFIHNLWNSEDLEYIEEVYDLEWVSDIWSGTRVSETNMPEFFYTNIFVEFARSYELSEDIQRRFMDEVRDRDSRRRVIDVFSTWQSLSNQFIVDYVDELYLPEIHARADELELTPETLALIESRL